MKIFITGGTTGIGMAVAKLYLKEGHEVAITGRDLKKVGSDITENFPKLKMYEVDVTDREQMKTVIENFAADGKLDIVYANAGVAIYDKKPLPDFERARLVIETNIVGVLNTFEPAMNIMVKQKSGHLVATASIAGMIGLPGTAAYSASKAAVLKLCESFAIDLKQFGIDVTTIAPGFIDTPLTQKNAHKMPFLLSEDQAAQKIKRAIENKTVLFIFPWQMKCIILFLDKMPRWLYRKIISTFKYKEKRRE